VPWMLGFHINTMSRRAVHGEIHLSTATRTGPLTALELKAPAAHGQRGELPVPQQGPDVVDTLQLFDALGDHVGLLAPARP
jgi:hypothetical protein